jgi:hypothetical protein
LPLIAWPQITYHNHADVFSYIFTSLVYFIFQIVKDLIDESPALSGGGERVRTDGLLRARQALSQLSYTPYLPLLDKSLVGLDGFEPSTSRLSGVRSNQTELQAPNPCLMDSFIHSTEPSSSIERTYLISQN